MEDAIEYKTEDKPKLHLHFNPEDLTEDDMPQMITKAAKAYGDFMDALGLDWRNDPHAKDTPMRVAKAFVNDYLKGIYDTEPSVTSFENGDGYDGIIFQGNIPIRSLCQHHHAPIIGMAHVAYIPDKTSQIIGLSKLNRISNHFARKPQVQENLTKQIHDHLYNILKGNRGVAVVIKARHLCTSHRGILNDSLMMTSKLSGLFFTNEIGTRAEFFNMINSVETKSPMV